MTNLSKTFLISIFSAALALPVAMAQQSDQMSSKPSNKSSAGMSAADSHFLKKAASGGVAEVELGQLAQQKASSEDVKKFGERMVTDHTKANDQLKQVAAQEHVDLPQRIDAKDQAIKAKLEKLSVEQFDRAYMNDMVKDHKTDVAEFAHESQMAKDPAVKSFATETLPVLREHLKEAQRIAPKEQATAMSGKSGQ